MKLEIIDDQFVIKDWNYTEGEHLKRVSGGTYNKRKNYYTFPLSWGTVLTLQSNYKGKITLSDEAKEWYVNHYKEFITPGYQLRSVIEPESSHYEGLYPHQNADIDFIVSQERVLLANGMGTGKTRSVVSAIRKLDDLGKDPFPVLWVAPASTLYATKAEFNRTIPEVAVEVLDGTITQKRKKIKNTPDVYIINYEAVPSLSRLESYGSIALKKCPEHGGLNLENPVTEAKCEVHPKELNNIDFNTTVLDESHRITNPKNKSTRAIKAATKHLRDSAMNAGESSRFKIAMTGTPIMKDESGIWSILNWLYPKEFPSRTKFWDRYFLMQENPFSGHTEPAALDPFRKDEFFQVIDPIMRRIPTQAVIDFLPPLVRETRTVDMNPKQKKAYKELTEDMLAWLDNDVLTVDSGLTQMTRLLQFASSYAEIEYEEVLDPETLVTEEKQKVVLKKPSNKISAFLGDLDDFGDDSQIVVFAVSKQLVYLLAEELDKLQDSASRENKWKYSYRLITGDQDTKAKNKAIDQFQNGDVRLILVTVSAGGTGITLTAANTMVFLQRPFSLVENQQAEARAHRIGSEVHDVVKIIDYVSSGTVEETKVVQALETKEKSLQNLLRDKEQMKKWLKETL